MITFEEMLTFDQRQKLANMGATRKIEGDRDSEKAGKQTGAAVQERPRRRKIGKILKVKKHEIIKERNTLRGKVKFFDQKKGWGFLAAEDGQDFFVHWKGILSTGWRTLEAGQEVAFEVEEGPDGRARAVQVEALQVVKADLPKVKSC